MAEVAWQTWRNRNAAPNSSRARFGLAGKARASARATRRAGIGHSHRVPTGRRQSWGATGHFHDEARRRNRDIGAALPCPSCGPRQHFFDFIGDVNDASSLVDAKPLMPGVLAITG